MGVQGDDVMTCRRERRLAGVIGAGVLLLAMPAIASAQAPQRAPAAPRVKNESVIDLERAAQAERPGQWRFGERADSAVGAPVAGAPAGEGTAARRPVIDLPNDQPPVPAGPSGPASGPTASTGPVPATGPAVPGPLAASLGIGPWPEAAGVPAPPGDPGGTRALAELLKQRGETEIVARVSSSTGRAQWRPAPPVGLPVASSTPGGWTEVQPGQVIRGRVEVRTGVGSSVELEMDGVGRVQLLRMSRATLTGVRGAGAERAQAAVDLSRGAVRVQPSAVMGGTLIVSTPRQLWRVTRPMEIMHDLVTGTTATEPSPAGTPASASPSAPSGPGVGGGGTPSAAGTD
jgi:hypothetical protein